MSGVLTKKEWHALMFAGARQSPERSTARPKQYYGDPAQSVEFEAERARKREAARIRQFGE